MAFEAALKRRGRNSRDEDGRPFKQSQGLLLGVDYSSSPEVLAAKARNGIPLSSYALNTDFGAPIGQASSCPGYEAVISTLGSGKVLGGKYWPHSTAGMNVFSWNKNLYLLSGGAGSISKSSQADWEAGTRTNLDTTTSAGDVTLAIGGANFSETATLTADFDGTHSDTVAAGDAVVLANSTGEYTKYAVTAGMLTNTSFYNFNAANCVDGSTATRGFSCDVGDIGGAYVKVDLGVGVTSAFRKCRIYVSGATGSFATQYSDNGSSWGNAGSSTLSLTGWNEITWADVGAHRYWRFVQGGDYVTTRNFMELEFYYIPTVYQTTGTYTHHVQNISTVGVANTAIITYNKTTPGTTAITVETAVSTDGGANYGAWTARASGDTVIPAGADISGYRFKWRATLTGDGTATPSLTDVAVAVNTGYHTSGEWVSAVLDLGYTPLISVLSWTITTPAGTAVTFYAAGSSNGTVFGDWREILNSGDAIPLQRYILIKYIPTGTLTATPTISDLLISFTTSYTVPYQLDISPLGRASNLLTGNRVSMEPYEDWMLCADGLRPFILYLDSSTQITGAAQSATSTTLRLNYDTDTKLLLHMAATEGSTTFLDDTGKTVTAVGDAHITTAQYKLGNSCGIFDGTGDYLSVADSDDFTFAGGNFTIKGFFRINALPGAGASFALAGQYVDASNFWWLFINNTAGTYYLKFINRAAGTDTVTVSGSTTLATATWYHICFTRSGNDWTIYKDNAQVGTANDADSMANLAAPLVIGAQNSASYFNGWISEFQIVKGVATSAVVPTEPYSLGASNTNDIYNNAFVTITGATTGAGQVRFIKDYDGTNHDTTVDAWDTTPTGTITYSIGSAVKVRNLGVDPPVNAPVTADSGVAGLPSGAYLYKVTGVNKDGVESNASPASISLTVASKKITVSIPVNMANDLTLEYWKIYRTVAGGTVYKYVDKVAIGTASFTDNIADAGLGSLMLDNNNIPGSADGVYPFNGYVFYWKNYEVWFSKIGAPDQVPNVTGDIQQIPTVGRTTDIKSDPMALVLMGLEFTAPITSNTGFIFDSDPSIDTTTMRIISRSGSTSAWSSATCFDKNDREYLMVRTATGLRKYLPGVQEGSLQGKPFSEPIQPYLERAINQDQEAGIFHGLKCYYLISIEYMEPGASVSERLTFVVDWRTEQFYGPWGFGMSCYWLAGNDVYAGDAENGIIYRMFTGNSFAGDDIEMICDYPVLSPGGLDAFHEFNEFMVVVSADSDTTDMQVIPKVDEQEETVAIGELVSTYTGSKRPGHNTLQSEFFDIPLPDGHALSHRVYNKSTNPLSVVGLVTRGEVLPID